MGNRDKRLNKIKLMIKASIMAAAKEYSKIAGKTFLFVYGGDYVELAFLTDRFAHLTGVKLYTDARLFYENAKNGTLSIDEYGFDERHKFDNAKKKPLVLLDIASWLSSDNIVLEDVQISERNAYDIGLSNYQSSILFTANTDSVSFVPNSVEKLLSKELFDMYRQEDR